jgi:hypothetical protein
MTVTLNTEQERRDYAKQAAGQMVQSLRESNAAYEARTGSPSTVSEAEYEKAEREIETAMLKTAGLKPLR